MICQSCGAQIGDGQKFCGVCGAKQGDDSVENLPTVPIEEELSANYISREETSETDMCQKPLQEGEQPPAGNSKSPQYTAPLIQQTTYEQPVLNPGQAAVPKKKKGRVKAAFLSVFVSFFVVIFTFLMLGILTFRSSLSEENVSSLVSNINVDEVIESDQFAEIEKEWKGRFTEQELKRIYKKSGAEDYLKSVAVEYSEYILGGEAPSGITAKDVISLVRRNADLIEEETGYKFKKSDYKDIENYMTDHEEEMGVFAPSEATGTLIKTVSLLTSVYMVVILGIILLLLLLWMFKVRYWSSSALSWFAYASITGIVAFMILMSICPVVLSTLGTDVPLVSSAVKLYVKNSIWCVIINSVILFIVNIIFVLLHAAIRAFKKRA